MRVLVLRVGQPIALVLDDDPATARAVGDALAEGGFAVTWATSVEEARRHIEAHPIAVVLVDLSLGEVRGRQLLDELARIDDAPPMLIVSGSEDAPAIAAELGISCVAKPFRIEELLAALAVTRGTRPPKRTASGLRPSTRTLDRSKKPKPDQ